MERGARRTIGRVSSTRGSEASSGAWMRSSACSIPGSRSRRVYIYTSSGGDDGTAAAVVTRQRPQVARYGEGDAFARHCDNYCPVGGHGPYCNERWLTCVYYASDREWWREVDGGCLRVYRPQGDARRDDDEEEQQDEGQASGAAAPREDSVAAHTYEEDAVVDIAPLADRLLLFRRAIFVYRTQCCL